MSSGMTGQTPVLTSRWDRPAQPKQNVAVQQQKSIGNPGLPASLSGVISAAGSSTVSQLPQTQESTPQGGVEMAAAMAAKINAMLMAKGKLLTPPPLLTKTPPSVPVPTTTEEMVVTEVDINDVPLNCRELLTKGKTQEEIRQFSGAVVSTKGHYMTEAERGNMGGQRPLYLHVLGKTQEQVNKAVARIKEIISEDVARVSAASGGQVPIIPPLTLYPQPPRPVIPPPVPRMPNATAVPGQGHRPAAPHTGSFVHTKIFVGLDQTLASFNIKEKVEGPAGSYLSHIQTETGARVFLRGKGSGYIEQASKRESFEPLYVYISHPNAAGLESAKKLTESLLETVRAEHARIMSAYTTAGTPQTYATHGFPPNSNYPNQSSWYNYPANGYAGGYAAYPGASGYWSNANGPPSQSNLSTTPPSSQAMVQYPVCPRKPHPFLVQDPGSSETVEPEGSLTTPPDSGSTKQLFQEGAKDEQPSSCSPEGPAHLESTLPVPGGEEKVKDDRILMPPPPPSFVAPVGVPRKRPREEDTASLPTSTASLGAQEEVCVKKNKLSEDSSGLVPYGGDSSDDEEERTRCSKAENS
ncbi:KH homology domain-containing protein 4 [Oryzias melastigma]|uniref:KH homology domain-containing protein 4 n=1 Tax=Oryzias melastigma TaxID=30732 RepID=A0A3B3BYN3_ORYME|nr:KH homology domain-containing protein 4 [Oryzias melastigma]